MKKIKKIWQSPFIKNYIIFVFTFLILEIIFRSIENLSLISYNMLRIFIGINILAFIFSFISHFLPKLISKIFNLIIILIVSIYGLAELGFNNYLGVYVSLQSSSQAGAVTSYFFEYLRSFHWYYYLMLIPFIIILIYYIFFDKKLTLDMPKRQKNMQFFITKCFQCLLFVFLALIYFATLKLDFMQDKTSSTSSYHLFLKPVNPALVINDFGFIEFGLLDIKECLIPGPEFEKEIEYNPNTILNFNNSKPEEENIILPHTTIDNDNWKEIIDNEKSTNRNTLNKYFISKEATYTNEYTGIFKNKNLILVMIESGSNIMINEEYYPNITKLYKEGYSFKNYYSPRNTCSTINNEFSNLTGLYTITNNCTAKAYRNNSYFESIFNLFNEAGYDTASFHDYTQRYYPRKTIHTNLGSQKYYGVEKLGIKYNWTYGDWPSDEDFIKSYLNILDETRTEKPFMNLLTTVTSHQPYTDNYQYNLLYKDDFPSEYPTDVRKYMSKIKVVDNAIGLLVDGLEERGLLDDTVIVLYADHYPYGIPQTHLNKVLDYDTSIDQNAENVPFIIYNPSLEAKTFEQYTGHINTTPTMANLFGLDYDSRIYIGSDVLDKSYKSLVIFDDASWKNEIAYFDASKNKIKYYTDKTYSDEEIMAINEEVNLKLKMSSLAIKNNYFSYLEKKLASYKVEPITEEDSNSEIDTNNNQDSSAN